VRGVAPLEREAVEMGELTGTECETSQIGAYEAPEVRDYGSLQDLTEGAMMGDFEDGSSTAFHPSMPTSP
jgi:hypothetical protein